MSTGRKAMDFLPNFQQIPRKTDEGQAVIKAFRDQLAFDTAAITQPAVLLPIEEVPDFLAGSVACDLSGEGTCEACQ